MLEDVHGTGMTYLQIARTLGIQHSTLQFWRGGGRPSHAYGEVLLELHAKVCGPSLTILRRQEAKPRL